jgi:hypothetical protein
MAPKAQVLGKMFALEVVQAGNRTAAFAVGLDVPAILMGVRAT